MAAASPKLSQSGVLSADARGDDWTALRLQLDAPAFAPEKIRLTIYLPPGYGRSIRRYPVLYANDGQDMAAVG